MFCTKIPFYIMCRKREYFVIENDILYASTECSSDRGNYNQIDKKMSLPSLLPYKLFAKRKLWRVIPWSLRADYYFHGSLGVTSESEKYRIQGPQQRYYDPKGLCKRFVHRNQFSARWFFHSLTQTPEGGGRFFPSY